MIELAIDCYQNLLMHQALLDSGTLNEMQRKSIIKQREILELILLAIAERKTRKVHILLSLLELYNISKLN